MNRNGDEMKVLMDATALRRPGLTGVGVYVRETMRAVAARADVTVKAGLRPRKWHLNTLIDSHWDGPTGVYWPYVTRGTADVFHAPDGLIKAPRGPARVVTIHDLFAFHDGYSTQKFLDRMRAKFHRLAARPWDAVLVPSEYVRAEIARYLPELRAPVVVVPHGADHITADPAVAPPDVARGGPYFLYLGTLELRKNTIGVIRAFERASELNTHRLLLVGGDGFGIDRVDAAIAASPARARIVRVGHLSNPAHVSALLRGATAMVLPSFAESFCIPLIEAMKASCPVITSNTTAIPEILGDAGLMVDPADVDRIKDAMVSVATEARLRADLIARGLARYPRFTWARAAELTVRAYADAVRGRR